MKNTFWIVLALVSFISSCSVSVDNTDLSIQPSLRQVDTKGAGGFSDPLTSFNSALWQKANWANGAPFGCGWNPNNVIFDGTSMVLKLDNTPIHGYAYSGAEYRTINTYSYGWFAVDMMAGWGSGVNTSFFLYTGTPVWDEIDFEVLGKNTWQIQLNYYVNGVGGHEKIIDLGFDAAAGYHNYKIEYGNGWINWYIDNNWVYGVNNQGLNGGSVLPSHPMQSMMNLWNGDSSVNGWLGAFTYSSPIYAHYKNYVDPVIPTPIVVTLNAWQCNTNSGGLTFANSTVSGWSAGKWIQFNKVNLGTASKYISFQYSAAASGSFEVRMDNPNGTLLGTFNYTSTGGLNTYKISACGLKASTAKGIHNLIIKDKSGSANLKVIKVYQ